jgi:hypothetical protein
MGADFETIVPDVLADRYASRAMVDIWSPRARIGLEREFWIAGMRAQRALGLAIPEEAIDAYERVKHVIDLDSIRARERVTRHDVKARIDEFCAQAGHEHIHKGLTSRDLTENVEQVQVLRSLRLLREKYAGCLARLADRVAEYRGVVLTGRTHNVPAQATTVGKRLGAPGGGSGGRSYSQVLRDLGEKLEARKRDRLREEVMELGFEALGPFEPELEECGVCHVESDVVESLRDDVEEERKVNACPMCKALYELGGDLRGLRKVWMAEDTINGFRSIPLPFGKLLWKGAGSDDGQAPGTGIVLANNWDMRSYGSPDDYGFDYPRYREGDDFLDLAKRSCGEHWLGVLRMDVDNLGSIFREGISEEERSFSRISVLSRMMNKYFRQILPRVLRGLDDGYEHFTVIVDPLFPRALEVVYAGGDDLFIVGAWDQLLEAAFDIRRTFGLYVCDNPVLHISGGMVIGRHDHPLHDLARLAEAAEKRAKRIDAGKDRIDLFNRPAKWSRYEKGVDTVLLPLLSLRDGARGTVRAENGVRRVELDVSRGFLRQVMSIAMRYEELEKRTGRGKLAFPYLAYVLARAREGFEKDFEKARLSKNRWETLEGSLFEPDQYEVVYALASWADLLTRGGKSDEQAPE